MSCGFGCKQPLDLDTACRHCMGSEIKRLREERDATAGDRAWMELPTDDKVACLEMDLATLRARLDKAIKVLACLKRSLSPLPVSDEMERVSKILRGEE